MPSERLQVILELLAAQYKKEAREAASATGKIATEAAKAGGAVSTAGLSFESAGKKMGEVGKTLQTKLTLPLLAVGGFAIKAASDLGESVNAINVVFGESAKKIHDWGETAAESAGVSQRAFNEAASVLGSALQTAGLTADIAADKTIELTKRAADMASVFNTDVDQALGAIQAALRGETDPIEKFGVSISAAAVDAKAAALGYERVGGEFDATAKAAARLAIIMEQTQRVQGDFANTSDGVANRMKILKARVEDAAASLGEKLLPITADALELLTNLVDKFDDLSPSTQETILKFAGLAIVAGPVLRILGGISTLLGTKGALGLITRLSLAAGAAVLLADALGNLAVKAGLIPEDFEGGTGAARDFSKWLGITSDVANDAAPDIAAVRVAMLKVEDGLVRVLAVTKELPPDFKKIAEGAVITNRFTSDAARSLKNDLTPNLQRLRGESNLTSRELKSELTPTLQRFREIEWSEWSQELKSELLPTLGRFREVEWSEWMNDIPPRFMDLIDTSDILSRHLNADLLPTLARFNEFEWADWMVDAPPSPFIEWADATKSSADQLVILRSAATTARDPIKKLSDALRDAAVNQRSLALAILEFVNPIAAAAGAMKRLTDAKEKVDALLKSGKKGTDEWAEAMLDLAVAKGEAQAALDTLSAQGIEVTASALAKLLQIPREEAEKLLEVLGLIDGKEVTVVVRLNAPRDITKILEGLSGEQISLQPQQRQLGGPVRAGQPYVVGEREAELFVPQTSGSVIPLSRMHGGMNRQSMINIYHPSSDNFRRDIQELSILQTITTMVESA